MTLCTRDCQRLYTYYVYFTLSTTNSEANDFGSMVFNKAQIKDCFPQGVFPRFKLYPFQFCVLHAIAFLSLY